MRAEISAITVRATQPGVFTLRAGVPHQRVFNNKQFARLTRPVGRTTGKHTVSRPRPTRSVADTIKQSINLSRSRTHARTHARARAHTHTFNGPLSGTTRVSRYQKGRTNLDLTEARDGEWQWHLVGQMQVCTSLRTDNHTSTPPLSFPQAGCPSCRPANSVKALKAR